MTGRVAPPMVPMHSQNLSPRNLSQFDFWDKESANMEIAFGNHHWSQQHCVNAVVHPVTGKEMEYSALMKDPNLQPLWKRGFGNETGRLFQGICDIPVTDTCLFVELTNIPKDSKINYGKIVCDYKPTKKKKNASGSRWGATGWTTPAMSQPPLRKSQHSKSSSTALSPQKMRS
jgi:hypothetical protein